MATHWNAHASPRKSTDTLRGREKHTLPQQLSAWRIGGARWVHSLKGLISQTQQPPHTAMNDMRTISPSLILLVFHAQTHSHFPVCTQILDDSFTKQNKKKIPSTHTTLPAIINNENAVNRTPHLRDITINKITDRWRQMTDNRNESVDGREEE